MAIPSCSPVDLYVIDRSFRKRILMSDLSSEPNETERLIQATREEARKTRTLLIWLLVGIPRIALVIWGIVAASSAVAVSTGHNLSVTGGHGLVTVGLRLRLQSSERPIGA